MVDDDFVAFQHPREDFPAQGEPVGNIQPPTEILLRIADSLRGLVIDGGESGGLAEQKAVNIRRYNMKILLQQLHQRKENLVRDSQTGKQQEGRFLGNAVKVEVPKSMNCLELRLLARLDNRSAGGRAVDDRMALIGNSAVSEHTAATKLHIQI